MTLKILGCLYLVFILALVVWSVYLFSQGLDGNEFTGTLFGLWSPTKDSILNFFINIILAFVYGGFLLVCLALSLVALVVIVPVGIVGAILVALYGHSPTGKVVVVVLGIGIVVGGGKYLNKYLKERENK